MSGADRPDSVAHEPGRALDALRDQGRLAPDMAGLGGSLRRKRSSRHLRTMSEGASRRSAAEQPLKNQWSRLATVTRNAKDASRSWSRTKAGHRTAGDANHGKESRKFKRDCTICRSCRWGVTDADLMQ